MATRRKRFNPPRPAPTDEHRYAEFVAALLDGTITAARVVPSRDSDGNLILSYDDPNG